MGNVQIIQPTNRRKPIFHHDTVKMPKKSLSPRMISQDSYRQDNGPKTERQSKNNQIYRNENNSSFVIHTSRSNNDDRDRSNSERKRSRIFVQTERSSNFKTIKSHFKDKNNHHNYHKETIQNNQTRCKEIAKKVRNFNDFLNQLKKKIRIEINQDRERDLNKKFQQTIRKSHIIEDEDQISFNDTKNSFKFMQEKKKDDKKTLTFAFRLENQKIELQKYKNLVQRQLSKNHSIENISLENRGDSEKILIIKYENQFKEQDESKTDAIISNIEDMKSKYFKKNAEYVEKINEDNKISLKNAITEQQLEYSEKMELIKIKYNEMLKRISGIDQILSNKILKPSEVKKQSEKMKKVVPPISNVPKLNLNKLNAKEKESQIEDSKIERISNIHKLFTKMDDICNVPSTQKEIIQILAKDDSNDD